MINDDGVIEANVPATNMTAKNNILVFALNLFNIH
jgi:hypothetical protein